MKDLKEMKWIVNQNKNELSVVHECFQHGIDSIGWYGEFKKLVHNPVTNPFFGVVTMPNDVHERTLPTFQEEAQKLCDELNSKPINTESAEWEIKNYLEQKAFELKMAGRMQMMGDGALNRLAVDLFRDNDET